MCAVEKKKKLLKKKGADESNQKPPVKKALSLRGEGGELGRSGA